MASTSLYHFRYGKTEVQRNQGSSPGLNGASRMHLKMELQKRLLLVYDFIF